MESRFVKTCRVCYQAVKFLLMTPGLCLSGCPSVNLKFEGQIQFYVSKEMEKPRPLKENSLKNMLSVRLATVTRPTDKNAKTFIILGFRL